MRYVPEALPEVGTRREKLRFAFWPIRLIDNSVIWLERFYIVEEWKTWSVLEEKEGLPRHSGYVHVTKFGWCRVAIRVLP